jgi:hypothetical protein
MFYGKTYAGRERKPPPDRSTGFSRNYLPEDIGGEKPPTQNFGFYTRNGKKR